MSFPPYSKPNKYDKLSWIGRLELLQVLSTAINSLRPDQRRDEAPMSTTMTTAMCCIFAVILTPALILGEDDAQKTAAIRGMRDEIARLKITVERDGKPVPADFKSEPILHYTDPERKFPDATLWAWTLDGQPVLFSKLEHMGGNPPQSQYCIATSQDARITVRWPNGNAWKSQKAGIDFQKIDDHTDLPQKTPQLRLIQLRTIAKRFHATTTDHENQNEEMRLLPQPILRYSNPQRSIVDGSVFALTSNGTNPDALLLVQIRQADGSQASWEFGVVGMTGDAVAVDLNGKSVYQHPGKPGPGDHGYWLWAIAPTN
jgi:hypothetical protein